MTDMSRVELAMHDRPAVKEVLGILLVCALLLVGLAKLDNEAAREYQARAEKALTEQRAAAPEAEKPSSPRPDRSIPAAPAWSGRTAPDSSDGASTWLAIMIGSGLLMAASGLLLLSRRSA